VLIGAMLLACSIGWMVHRLRSSGAPMSVSEARALLDLPANADADAVRAAHRRLIARVHPDAGGTEVLARNVNLARDTLLKDLRRTAPGISRGN
jgi:DnaJ family protein C protein 19